MMVSIYEGEPGTSYLARLLGSIVMLGLIPSAFIRFYPLFPAWCLFFGAGATYFPELTQCCDAR